MEKKLYRIYWKSRITGETDRTGTTTLFTEKRAKEVADALNNSEEYPEIYHWYEFAGIVYEDDEPAEAQNERRD